MNQEEFQIRLHAEGLDIDEHQLQQLKDYLHLLQEWNEKMNLTAITDEEEVWEKHFYDSLRPFAGVEFETLCDVGSGAGFPGIPLAIAYPDRQFTLVEPLGKRCRFLEAVKEKLGLANVTIVNARAEDFAKEHREEFDAVSARAVARLSILLELCVPLLKTHGTFIAMKGSAGDDEAAQAAPALKALFMKLDKEERYDMPDGSTRINLYYTKEKKTPARYPRNYGQIKKKPLEVSHG